MDTEVLSPGVRYSNSPESHFRPESDRPRLSEVSACDGVPVIDFLGLEDRSQVVQKIAEANKSYGPFQMDTEVLSPGVRYSNSPESHFRPESDRPRLSEVSACDGVPVIDFLGLEDRSQVVQKIAEANKSYGPFQMDTEVLSPGVRYSNSPESHFRPESDRPRLSEVSACDGVPVIDFLGLEDRSQVVQKIAEANKSYGPFQMDTEVLSPGVRYSNSPESHFRPESDRPRLSEVSACDDVPVIDFLGLEDRSQVVDVPVIDFLGLEDRSQEKLKLYSDDPSKIMRLSTSYNVNNEIFDHGGDDLRLDCHPLDKYVLEWPSNPPDFNSREGKHFYSKGSSEASDEGGAFQVPASDCKSNLDSTDLDKIRRNYQIPDDVVLRVPNYVDNVCSVNEGEIVLYRAFFEAGLRLPFHPFIGELLRRLGLAPGQLTPNAWRIIVCWLNLWQSGEDSAELSVDKFLYCYQLHKVPKSPSHWCLFARNNDTKLGIELPSSNGFWKNNYLVVRGVGEALLEGVNWSWGVPNKFDRPNLDDFHLNSVIKAVEFSRRNHNSLVTPQNLVPLSGDAEKSNQKGINTKIQSQKKAKLSILGKRNASSELSSQEFSAHGVIPPVIGPTTSSVEAILPLPVVDGPPRPSKGKEVAITPTIDTDDASETVRSKQVHIEQDVTDDLPSMIRNLFHLMEEGKEAVAQHSAMSNMYFEMANAIKDVVLKKLERLES